MAQLKRDSSEAFVVSQITRVEIAQALNRYVSYHGMSVRKFADDDFRLSHDLCSKFAKSLEDYEENGDEWVGFEIYESACETLLSELAESETEALKK